MADSVECAVIGAGVVGLAVARALAMGGREVIVLETADAIGTGTSSRNSEVIHAGIYYPAGSLKARLCVAGNRMLRHYCTDHGVTVDMVGKLIVATDQGEVAALEGLLAKAEANAVTDLRWLTAEEAVALEPNLACQAALLSPSTGIFDSHAYMLALRGDAEAAGAVFAFRSPVVGGRIIGEGIALDVGGDEPSTLACRTVVNCAGLGAQGISRAIIGLDPAVIPPLHLCKGNYYYLAGKPPFRRLVYPVPCEASLGLHYTRDLAGQGRFGPDVEWTDVIDYRVSPHRAASFYDGIRRYWPDLPDGSLQPGYSGIRPKIQGPGEAARDFVIAGPRDHGIPGLMALYGIESPGLTASLAIAEMVAEGLG